MRVLNVCLGVMLCFLTYDIWYGRNGIADYHASAGQLQQALASLQRQVRLNERLAVEVADLHQGQAAVEDVARRELGMIKSTETFYRVIAAPAP